MPAVFEVIRINNTELMSTARSIRLKVFVEEQGIDRSDEIDAHEAESRHFLVRKIHSGLPVGTARWRLTSRGNKLERFCVLPQYRHQGAGSLLLREIMADIVKHSPHPFMYLNAQADAVALYEKQGFSKSGDLFLECNIPHYSMIYHPESKSE